METFITECEKLIHDRLGLACERMFKQQHIPQTKESSAMYKWGYDVSNNTLFVDLYTHLSYQLRFVHQEISL